LFDSHTLRPIERLDKYWSAKGGQRSTGSPSREGRRKLGQLCRELAARVPWCLPLCSLICRRSFSAPRHTPLVGAQVRIDPVVRQNP
ncbi:MAG TPA: hypothetical protein VK902_01215, partial [Rubrobacter sp.]|nr:hypothetical protein [Rubrobacter sp.]